MNDVTETVNGLTLPLDSNAIQKIIPHRYPFLLVDRIDEMTEDSVVGVKAVSANEMQFLGHFPEKHLMPGVLIVEALAQTGAVLILSKPEYRGKLAVFAGIDKLRFRRQVVPGDVIRLESRLLRMRSTAGFAAVKASVDGETVCEGQIMFALTDAAGSDQ